VLHPTATVSSGPAHRLLAYTPALLMGALGLGFLVALGLRAATLWPFTVDDTFITLRYAKHLAQGLGPVWNPGGPLVEGYTSALWVLLLALPEALGSTGPLAAKLISLALAALSMILAAWLAHEVTFAQPRATRCLAAATPFALGAAYWKLAVHAVSGMETTLTACLLAGFACALVALQRTGRVRDARWLAIFALLATLARPEAALATGVSLAILLVTSDAKARLPIAKALVYFAIAPGVVYFATRYWIFGLLFPLPFYVKATGQVSLAGLPHVRAFVSDFVLARPFVALLCVLGTVSAWRLLRAPVLGALACALFFLHPKHIMGFEGRYLVPLLPIVFAAAGVGLASLVLRLQNACVRAWPRHSCAALAWLLLVVTAWLPFPDGYQASVLVWRGYGESMQRAHIALADALREHKAIAARPVVAMLDVGAVAYFSDWSVIDTYGLNDVRVALSRRTDLAYVFAQAPELLVLVSLRPDRFEAVFDWEVELAHEADARGYVTVRSYAFEPDYHLRVLARPDSRVGAALSATAFVRR